MLYQFPVNGSSLENQWFDTFQCLLDLETDNRLDYQYRSIDKNLNLGELSFGNMERIPKEIEMNGVNITNIAEQLYLLGYLDLKPKDDQRIDQSDMAFQSAVIVFQTEAGLTIDGWVGNETWRALQALVGFESDTDIIRWQLEDGTFRRAFRRAVQLRLHTYGLVAKIPARKFSHTTKIAKDKFKKILWSLGMLHSIEDNVTDLWLYRQLFDADKLLFMSSRSARKNSFHDDKLNHLYAKSIVYSSEKKLYQEIVELKGRFIVNLVKIEIWLLGGDTKVDGKGNFAVRGLGHLDDDMTEDSYQIRSFRKDQITKKAIESYLVDMLKMREKEKKRYLSEITPELLKSFIQPEIFAVNKTDAIKEKDYSTRLLQKLDQQNDHGKESIEQSFTQTVKEIGMKLYDGLKRLWKWITNVGEVIVDFSKNLFRSIFRFANKAYKIVRLSYSAFMVSLSQYLRGVIETKTPNVTIIIEKDMDIKVIQHPDVNEDDILKTKRQFTLFGIMFSLSSAIISTFIKVIHSSTSGLVGWVRLVRNLIESYSDIQVYYRQLSDSLS